MEPNPKSRGKKHHNNKAHYQNKAKVVPNVSMEKGVPDKKNSKKKNETSSQKGLQSNWDRYKEPSDDEHADEFTNFSLLAQAPISHGGHFQFKSDKNIESQFDFETLRNSKTFSLDLKLLEGGLKSIPFHERCGIDQNYFSEKDLKEINKRAEENQAEYESCLKLKSVIKDFSQSSVSSCKSDDGEDQQISKDKGDVQPVLSNEKSSSTKCENTNNDFQEKTVQEKSTHEPKEKVQTKADKDQLEDWLDDILDD